MPHVEDASQPGYLVDHAAIQWRDGTSPWSPAFEDIYWHRLGGLAEKQHVFIEANQLATRWQNLQQNHFTIVETGFGFGLNFLLAAGLWQQIAPQDACLHFVAIEHAPVAPADLKRLYASLQNDATTHSAYTGLADLARALTDRYPMPSHGMHPLWITNNICLTLIYADIVQASAMLSAPVDAFFLDGFSPALNSAMWDPRVFDQFAKISHANTTLSTYSVAGVVKRGLRSAGFLIQKVPGFGGKAEMLTARLATAAPPEGATQDTISPIAINQIAVNRSPVNRPSANRAASKKVAIIGAGLAGLNCAKALLRRGITVDMFDARQAPLLGASVIPQLAIYPQLAAAPDNRARFSLAAFQYLLQQGGFEACGFTVAADTPRLSKRFARINDYFPDNFVRQIDSPLGHDAIALAYADGGWLNAANYFAATLAEVTLHLRSPINELTYQDGHWQLLNTVSGVLAQADIVIIAQGAGSLLQTLPIGLDTNRGQALQIEGIATDQVVSGPITVFPKDAAGFSTISGTHERNTRDDTIREVDTQTLLAQQQRYLPGDTAAVKAFAGLRSTSRDRLPVVGPIPDWSALADWSMHHHREQPAFDAYQPGLFFCGGLGSHGATHGPLCGEILARLINTEPNAVDPAWLKFLAPGRFMLRDVRRTPAGTEGAG